jgi:HAUS augmin-like complex subunit 1
VQEAAVAQQTLCMDGLHSRLKADLMNLNSALRELEADDNLTIPCDMATKVNEWIRTSRHLKNKTEDYKERLETMEKNPSARGLTIPALAQTEKEILSLKERVLDLEAQTRGFQGLPPEKDLARLEVERVQGELEGLQAKLEKLYDGMISGSR